MFNKENRYLTRGIQAEIDPVLQLYMWGMIDDFKLNEDIKQDYLQVFRLKKEDNKIFVTHSQEEPDYKNTCIILNTTGIELDSDKKIFVIDDGDYSTMLLAEEY
jgi:hypothetical protein